MFRIADSYGNNLTIEISVERSTGRIWFCVFSMVTHLEYNSFLMAGLLDNFMGSGARIEARLCIEIGVNGETGTWIILLRGTRVFVDLSNAAVSS
jgi:hypothetical protein